MKKITILLIIVGSIVGVFFALNATRKQTVTEAKTISSPTVVQKEAIVPQVPKKIRIESIGVDAEIESVSKDEKGNMDIPSNFINTAWYNLGPRPGEKGSAVIDGHVDTPTGAPSVFADIKDLKPKDVIEIEDESGKTYTFEVIKTIEYDLKDIPLDQIFSVNTEPMLNLITCSGVWDKASKTYSARTVVYSRLIP